jgi:hypothetical protein
MAGRASGARLGFGCAALALCAALAIATPGGAGAGSGSGVKLARVGTFDNPVYITDAPGARRLLFVVELPGSIRVLRGGKELSRPFLDIRSRVRYGGEQGLLSVAFDPRYAKNRRFYVYYVDTHGDIAIDALRAKRGDPTRADPRSRRRLLSVPHPVNSNHNGGQLQFGPDGFLYIGTGDGGAGGDPNQNAQNRDSLLGKLLRIKPGAKGYTTPSSNPFASGAGRDEIYALGLRNPYRFSFDRKTDDLWIGDVGQDDWEEIDHETLANTRGSNFGWDLFEGNHVFEGSGDAPPDYRRPVFEYPTGGPNCAVTGGYVVRDRALGGLRGRYIYADFCAGNIRSFAPGSPGSTDAPTGLHVELLSSFGEASNGNVFAVSLNGPVYRLKRR